MILELGAYLGGRFSVELRRHDLIASLHNVGVEFSVVGGAASWQGIRRLAEVAWLLHVSGTFEWEWEV